MPVVTIPRKMVKEINSKYIKIEISEEMNQSYADLEAVKAAKGILTRNEKEYLSYIEKSRSEWQNE